MYSIKELANYISLDEVPDAWNNCFEEIKKSYNGEITTDFSTNVDFLNNCTAVYEEFDGNFGDISNCKSKEDLPEKAQKYLARIEEFVGVPVKFIGTGAGREDMIIR